MSSDMSIEKRNELIESAGKDKEKELFKTENDNVSLEKEEKSEQESVSKEKETDINTIVENVRELAKSFEKPENDEQEETTLVAQKKENKKDISVEAEHDFEEPV